MKKIVLIRHGKAAMAGKDHERELDEDGIIQAESLKHKLVGLGLKSSKIYQKHQKRRVDADADHLIKFPSIYLLN